MPWPQEAAETDHVAGLGWALTLPQRWKSGWGQILWRKLLNLLLRGSHKERDNSTLKISSLKPSPRTVPTFSAQDPWL